MKRLFAILALVGAFGLSSPAWSDEPTTATEEATSVAVSTSAATTAATAPAPHSLKGHPLSLNA